MYIWLDDSLIHGHVGIRRTLINLKSVLEKNHLPVTFLLQEEVMQRIGLVRELTFPESWLSNNGLKSVNAEEFEIQILDPIFSVRQLLNLGEDSHVLGAPWLISGFKRINTLNRVRVFVFLPDLIPLEYSIEGKILTSDWTASHSYAINLAQRNEIKLLVCSDQISTQIKDLFTSGQIADNILVIDPGIYVDHLETFTEFVSDVYKYEIVMVNLLDPRKGLEVAANFISDLPIGSRISLISGIRCSETELAEFLGVLKDFDFEWIKSAGTGEIVKKFLDSKYLLFPSLHEGYGIPALEANYFGLTVLTHADLPVWKDLAFKRDLGRQKTKEYNLTESFKRPADSEIQAFRHKLSSGANAWVKELFTS